MAYETGKVIQVDIQAQYGTGGGTTDYEKLKNKPQINGNELIGNKTSEELGLIGTNKFEAHVNDFDNPHKVTKSQIGLDKVNNTADVDKPVSTAQKNAIDAVQNNLDEEITRAKDSESNLKNQIDTERTRATNAESTLQSNIDAEQKRADEMEKSLQTKINIEISDRKSADSTLKNTIDAETQRATGVENDLREALTTETSARESADTQLQTNINTESNRAQTAEQTNATAISGINKKIPAQASESNQLADKAFVNSSINNIAAVFRGNYPTQVDLLAVAWQTTNPNADYYVTNNDYAYVESITATSGDSWSTLHAGEAWRYLYTIGTGWQPQFKVNDSPFTAEQLAAINSGATTENIGQIETNKTKLASHIVDTNNPHNVTKQQVGLGNVDNTSDLNKPVSNATKNYINAQISKLQNFYIEMYESGSVPEVGQALTLTNANFARVPSADQYFALMETVNTIDVYYTICKILSVDTSTCTASVIATTEITNGTELNTFTQHINNKLNPHAVTKAQVGLDKVDNTADTNKPVSTAQKTYIDTQDSATLNSAKAYTDEQIGTINTALTTFDTGTGV